MKIKLSFLGAAQNVTGSRHMLEADGFKVLVDCGLYQERHFIDRNWDRFPVAPDKIDAVLLTHAHLDHCGLLPKLVKEGFRGRIYCTAATAEIAQIILLDAGHLQEEDAAYKAKRHRKEGRKGAFPERPLYTAEDAEKVRPFWSPLEYGQPVKLSKHGQAVFANAGHVLGSSMINVRLDRNGESRTVLFSGDVGRKNMPIIPDPDELEQADYMLVESTYGDRTHDRPEDVKARLAEVIGATVRRGGNVVIPSFALERSQDLLYHINELHLAGKLPDVKVFLDSPMAIAITQVFQNHPELFDRRMTDRVNNHTSPFDLPNLVMSLTTDQSKAINYRKEPSIIIAGSGMCTGGRIKHHIANNLARKESTILFIGYQAVGTLGRTIADGAEQVRIHGRMHQVLAQIERINGFSAHADKHELLNWIIGLKTAPREVFVVHGEAGNARAFAEFLKAKTGWKVTAPAYRDEVVLE